MEVLFAIGIVLVGLVGIAALIPLAGRQVVDSKTATLGAAMAQNAYRAIEAANLHVPSTDRRWLIARDDSTHPTGQQFTEYKSFESLIDAEATWVANLAINNGVANTVAIPLARAYASRRGYCIDPLFWSNQPIEPPNAKVPFPHPRDAAVDFPYRRSRFPHYHELYNPLYDPVATQASGGKINIIPNLTGIDDTSSPRMFRISYASSPFAPYIPARARFAESIFASTDDITNPLSNGDRSLNGIRGYFTQGGTLAQGANLMQAASSQGISWMATLAPIEQSGSVVANQFRLSVILFANRDRTFDASGIDLDPRALPNAEQVAWAYQPDFSTLSFRKHMSTDEPPRPPLMYEYSYCGENGFAVDFYCNSLQATPVKVGDWVMLSRRWRNTADSGNPILDELNTVQLHRWYRVVSAMPPQIGVPSIPLPHTKTNPNGVARQSVQLIGPDWYFQHPPVTPLGGNPNAPLPPTTPGLDQQRPTQATIVRGVSAVYERTVTIPME
jgi:hypothetical protein